jgi:hypothetical protein
MVYLDSSNRAKTISNRFIGDAGCVADKGEFAPYSISWFPGWRKASRNDGVVVLSVGVVVKWRLD